MRLFLAVPLLISFCSPLLGQSEATVFEDHDFSGWQLFEPPQAPGIELVRLAYANPYLFVRHRHEARFYSRFKSVQGDPAATYDPAARGAAASFSFTARFRPHFDGQPPAYYAQVGLQVRPLVRQGGRSFVSNLPIFSWGSNLPPLPWAELTLPGLAAADFLRDGTEPVHPDFSSAGGVLTFGFEVTSGFQASLDEIRTHTFEVDIDDFRVRVAAPSDGLPTVRIVATQGAVDANVGPLALYRIDGVGLGFAGEAGLPLAVSFPAAHPIAFLLNDGETRVISPGETFALATVHYSALRAAEVFSIDAADGAHVGEPRYAAFLLSRRTGDFSCAYSEVLEWNEALLDQGVDVSTQRASGARRERSSIRSGLDVLREFRDLWMLPTSVGARYAELYRTFSPALVRAMLARPTLVFELLRADGPWIEAIEALLDGAGGTSLVTPAMQSDLTFLLNQFGEAGGGALARAIATERARLGLDAIAGLSITQFWQRVLDRGGEDPCVASATTLCLNGGRHRVEADFTAFDGTRGRAHAVPLSGSSGYFWFFDPANVEILSKVIDGCGANERVWSYNAGLTNLAIELTVVESETGRGRIYTTESAQTFGPILDSNYLPCDSSSLPGVARVEASARSGFEPVLRPEAIATCSADGGTLCLGGGGRFRVTASYRTAAGATGSAHAAPLTADTGTFWFFSPANVELVIKSINACGLAGFENHWIFAAGTTDVEVTLVVEDTVAHVTKSYFRPLGTPFAPELDTVGFATCP